MKSVTATPNDDGTVDLTVKQGCTLRWSLIVKSKQEDGSYLPVDLTGYAAKCEVRKTRLAVDVAAAFDCTIPDPSTGRIDLEMPAVESKTLKGGPSGGDRTYFYDVKVYRLDPEDVFRPIEGKLIGDPQVTGDVP